MQGCSLKASGPIRLIRQHHAVISRLDVSGSLPTSEGSAAIYCEDSMDVTIREVRVQHGQQGTGILFVRCHRLRIERVEVVANGIAVPNSMCAHRWKDCDNIHGMASEHVSMREVQVMGGSSGIELHLCTFAKLYRIVAFELRGPFPRGQAVQFSRSPHSSLLDFYAKNTADRSWCVRLDPTHSALEFRAV